jgi:hypothetical protein
MRRAVARSPTSIETRYGSSSPVLAEISDHYQRDACNQLRCRPCMGRSIKCVLSELPRSPAGVGLSKEDQAVISLMVLTGTVKVARFGARGTVRRVMSTIRSGSFWGWLLLHWT